MTEMLCKCASKKDLPVLPFREFFHVYIIISNHTVFLVQFGINLRFVQFQLFEKLTRAN